MSLRTRQTWAALTDVGRMRSHNEDAVLADPPLFVVADGLGGHEAGEVASQLAVETLRDHAPRRPDANALARAIRAANREVIRAAREGIGRSGMGTTITAALVDGAHVTIGHVGDSRAYVLSAGALSRVTRDHSMVADMIRTGQITEAESRVHPNRSVITRALGTDPNMVADTYEIDAAPGDRLLLCSDGLSSMLLDRTIATLLGSHADPAAAARALVDAANEAGGQDNISVIVVDLEGERTRAPGVRDRERSLRFGIALVAWLAVLALIIAGVAYGTYRYARSRAFLVSAPDGTVTLYRGVPGNVGELELHWHVESSPISVEDLSPGQQAALARGQLFDSVEEARAFLRSLSATSGP